MSSKMRAGDLHPGWYYAHGSDIPDCEIISVTRLENSSQVQIEYRYGSGGVRTNTYTDDRLWKVRPVDYWINEECDLLEALASP